MAASIHKDLKFQLQPDKHGMLWDLILYIPTVTVLVFIGLNLWYDGNQMFAYLLCFLASYFFIAGANRIMKTRLMLLPGAPTALKVGRRNVSLTLRSGDNVDLVKDLRFFSDYAGKSFALSGMDLAGRKCQFILHKGQFPGSKDFQTVVDNLKKFA